MRPTIAALALSVALLACDNSQTKSGELDGPAARVETVSGALNLWEDGNATALAAGAKVGEGSELRTDATGKAHLVLPDGSTVDVEPDTTLKLVSLENASHGTLIQFELVQGALTAKIAPPATEDGTFAVHTKVATAIGGEQIAVRMDEAANLMTAGAIAGVTMIQTESESVQPINLSAGEQVSLNAEKMGPIVAVGAPPGLEEPTDLKNRLLDLGQIQVCEKGEAELCGTWSWNRGQQQFDATYAGGATATLKVERMSGGEIVLTGNNGRYVGHDGGTEMLGDVAHQILEGTVTWTRNGVTTEGTWRGLSSYLLDLNPQ